MAKLQNAGLSIQGHQPTERMPHFARQEISNGTQGRISTFYISMLLWFTQKVFWSWPCIKTPVLLRYSMIWNLKSAYS